ncbi:hypothetical protein ETI65_06190 [Proteus mirabilis]|nr:hypothetical protein [Proteus mirabilis]MBN7243172.1 hypothetical protein [Proteus mirabilis]
MIKKLFNYVKNLFKREKNMNNHLENYLNYYKALDNPGYAVLITGGWGSGKTYQIKKYFEVDNNFCYVSLFGITSVQEIYSSVFVKMFPKKAFLKRILGKMDNIDAEVSSLTLGLGSVLSSIGTSLIKEEIDDKKIIIFDDLERVVENSNISHDEILGVINNYIEHKGCKVIVIAHDEKILNNFNEKKEKIFGQTITIKPNLDNALNSFLINKNIYRYYPTIKELLYNTFDKSEHSSLRVLKYVVNDCDRLFQCIKDLNLEKKHLDYLFYYFIIVCIEIKIGYLSITDYEKSNLIIEEIKIKKLSNIDIKANEANEEATILNILNKYGLSDFNNELIQYKSIIEIIKNGYFNDTEIVANIKNSNYLKERKKLPSWYKLFLFDSSEKDQIDSALSELESDFLNRKFDKFGDIFHLFNFMFLKEKLDNPTPKYKKIFSDCKNYVNDLCNQKRLQRKNPNNNNPFDSYQYEYLSKSYWIDKEYKRYSNAIRIYLTKKMHEMFYSELSIYNPLDKMINDLDSLISDCTISSRNMGSLYKTPLFHMIKPEEFVDTWLSLPVGQQEKIRMLFVSRYSMDNLNSTLTLEKNWIKAVFTSLDYKASTMAHFHRYRVERLKMQIPTS